MKRSNTYFEKIKKCPICNGDLKIFSIEGDYKVSSKDCLERHYVIFVFDLKGNYEEAMIYNDYSLTYMSWCDNTFIHPLYSDNSRKNTPSLHFEYKKILLTFAGKHLFSPNLSEMIQNSLIIL